MFELATRSASNRNIDLSKVDFFLMFEITTRSISTTLIQDGNTSSMMFRNQHRVLTSSISSMMSSTSYHVLQVFPVDFGCALQLSPTDTHTTRKF